LAALTASIAPAAEDRVKLPVDSGGAVTLQRHLRPEAQPQYDQGPLDPNTPLASMTLVLRPAPTLAAFLEAQQTPQSPDYRRWLTPEQFGDRFGLSPADLSKVVSWLEAQGFVIQNVARGRHWINFSGTAGQASRAFHTGIHRYRLNGETHFANVSDPAIPEAFSGVVAAIRGLHDFYPRPRAINAGLKPQTTVGNNHYLAPDDLATIYDIKPLYTAGIDGTGQTIVIVGASAPILSDIRSFRRTFNLPQQADPKVVLVGADPGIDTGWQQEEDLDLQWAGAVARNATLVLAYSANLNDAVQYAADQNLGTVISMSFAGCELWENPEDLSGVAQQANAQGITLLAGSGDAGAAQCDVNGPMPQATKGPTVSFPASLPEVTAVGGTEFNEAGGAYWQTRNDVNSASAISFIPEKAWNDALLQDGLWATGGGASALIPKPYWQTGPGVPGDGARDVPDVSLTASALHDPYQVVYNSSTWLFGGTSASTPSFAGIVALLNNYLVKNNVLSQPGLGNINPALYRISQATTDVFHDTTAGDNKVPCQQGTPGCGAGGLGFAAGPGYDMATGLGSVDAYKLATEWNTGASSATTVAVTPSTFNLTDSIQITAVVTGGGSAIPTGTVKFTADDYPLGSASLTPSGNSAAATFTVTGLLLGGAVTSSNWQVYALYGGDGVYAGSAASTPITLNLPATSGSYVVPLVFPNPVYQLDGVWPYSVNLSEKAGVATTLTSVVIDGVTQSLAAWTSTKLPANGVIAAGYAGQAIAVPKVRQFVFNGRDANGVTWTQQLSVPFVAGTAPQLTAAMSLTSSPATVEQNPATDPGCQWSQQLTVQETGGFEITLNQLTVGSNNFSSQIQTLFGTARLAPYGSLQATLCQSGTALSAPVTQNIALAGVSETGVSVQTSTSVSYAVATPGPATPSVSPAALTLTGSGTAALALAFAGGAPQWTASILPANRTSNWLTVTPPSGAGSASLTVSASADGLAPGVYNAMVTVQATGAVPQWISVPVVLTVGGSSSIAIGGVTSNASFAKAFAPGMQAAVFGTGLAPAGKTAPGLPLPVSLNGVSATVNGVTAPLYYVSPGQVNLQIPYETSLGTAVLALNNNGQVASFQLPISMVAPGIYPVVIDATADAYNTASPGDVVEIFITGDGDLNPSLATGATPASGTAASQLPKPRQPVSVTVAGTPAAVAFAGVPNGLAGVTQINFTIPSGVPAGSQPVVVTVGPVSSPPMNLTIFAASK
jgi:uncharacterized protein (TIGR03437 family)